MPSYQRLQQYALAISVVSIFYCSAEGAVSIAFGSESSSRALIFFGIQSGIEVASAAIVFWRFRHIAKPGEEDAVLLSDANLRVEKIGTWSIGILIAILSIAAEVSAIVSLVQHTEPDASNASLIISASALVLMILLWLPKRWLAHALDSSTMAGEATCSLSCIQITIVLFTGSLVFRLWRGGWWVDSATTIVLGLLFAREAWKMLAWVDAELGEQYRDLCGCCGEKEECKDADSCKCETTSEESEPCCVPVNPDGAKCCSRELVKGPRPQSLNARVEPDAAKCIDRCCADESCAKDITTSSDADSCCKQERSAVASPAPIEEVSCQKKCCGGNS